MNCGCGRRDAAGQALSGSVAVASAGPVSAQQVVAQPNGGFVSVWLRGPTGELFGEVFILA